MEIKLKKNENGEYEATFVVGFNFGEIDIKKEEEKLEDGTIVIQTGANVQAMKRLYKDNLESHIDLYDEEKREKFNDMLEEYVRFSLLEKLQLEKIPPRVVLDQDGSVKDIDGLKEGSEYEIIED